MEIESDKEEVELNKKEKKQKFAEVVPRRISFLNNLPCTLHLTFPP